MSAVKLLPTTHGNMMTHVCGFPVSSNICLLVAHVVNMNKCLMGHVSPSMSAVNSNTRGKYKKLMVACHGKVSTTHSIKR